MGVKLSLSLLPALEIMFFLLDCLVQCLYEELCLVMFDFVLSYFVLVFWRPVFPKEKYRGSGSGGEGNSREQQMCKKEKLSMWCIL